MARRKKKTTTADKAMEMWAAKLRTLVDTIVANLKRVSATEFRTALIEGIADFAARSGLDRERVKSELERSEVINTIVSNWDEWKTKITTEEFRRLITAGIEEALREKKWFRKWVLAFTGKTPEQLRT